MQSIGRALVFSPTDLNDFLDCAYLIRLDLEAARGRPVEKRREPEADVLAAKGEAHERRHLERFEREGRRVVRIPRPGPEREWVAAAEET